MGSPPRAAARPEPPRAVSAVPGQAAGEPRRAGYPGTEALPLVEYSSELQGDSVLLIKPCWLPRVLFGGTESEPNVDPRVRFALCPKA